MNLFHSRLLIGLLLILVTGTVRLAHAADAADAPGSKPFPGGEGGDVWVLGGQSNMLGWGLVKAPVKTDPRIFVFTKDCQWEPAEAALHREFGPIYEAGSSARQNIILQREAVKTPGGLTAEAFVDRLEKENKKLGGVGPGFFFARHIIQSTNRPIGLIFSPWGGASMKQWDPASKNPSDFYPRMIEQVREVGGKVKGVLWYQGEAECYNPSEYDLYQERLLNLFDSFRRDLGNPDLPIIYVQVSRFTTAANPQMMTGWEKVREVQRQASRLRKNVWFVSGIDLPMDDFIHIAYEGQERLGRRIAEVALTEVYKAKGHATPIDFESVEVLQPNDERAMLRVRFSGVNGRLTAPGRPTGFELRAIGANQNDGNRSMIYRVDFDPKDPAAVILGITHPIKETYQLYYAPGIDPYVNIVDEKDIALPAFGPVEVKVKGDGAEKK